MRKILLTSLLCATGHALAAEGPEFRFSGYGTIGAAVTNTDEAQFISSKRQSKGAAKSADFGVDSRLGVQGNVKFNDTFSAVGQLLANRQDGSDKPHVEWLYGQAKPLEWLELRGGRMVLPVFLVSDSRNVGYASHWLRAPGDVYSLYPLTSFDGLQAQARAAWGGTNFSLQLSGGKAEAALYVVGKIDSKFDDIQSFNLVAEHGDWTARLGRTRSKLTFSNFPRPFADVSDVFTGVGLQYDDGRWLVMSEYTTRRQQGGGLDSNSYYVSAGYRIGAWTPYATVTRLVPKGSFFAVPETSRTEALGLRWDAFKNVALKAQVERVSGISEFVKQTPAFSGSQPKVRVFSLTADFVF